MVADNVKAGLMTLFLGGVGDIISRVLWYNCSVDKAWTLLLFMPPLSIVSAIFYFLNKIEKGAQTCGFAADAFLYIIPIVTILLSVLISQLMSNEEDDNSILSSIITIFSIFVLYMIIRMYKLSRTCDNVFKEKYKGFNMDLAKRAFFISLITNGCIAIINTISPFLEIVPVVGMGFSIWGFLDYVPGLQHALLLTLSHYITNLIENMPNTLESKCVQ